MTREEIKEIIIKFTGEKGWELFCNSSGGKIGLEEFNKTFSIYEMIELNFSLNNNEIFHIIDTADSYSFSPPYAEFLKCLIDLTKLINEKAPDGWDSEEQLRTMSNAYFQRNSFFLF